MSDRTSFDFPQPRTVKRAVTTTTIRFLTCWFVQLYMTVYTRLGEKDKALAWLEKVAQERNRFALEFKVNPIFDSLRDEPRFRSWPIRPR